MPQRWILIIDLIWKVTCKSMHEIFEKHGFLAIFRLLRVFSFKSLHYYCCFSLATKWCVYAETIIPIIRVLGWKPLGCHQIVMMKPIWIKLLLKTTFAIRTLLLYFRSCKMDIIRVDPWMHHWVYLP